MNSPSSALKEAFLFCDSEERVSETLSTACLSCKVMTLVDLTGISLRSSACRIVYDGKQPR